MTSLILDTPEPASPRAQRLRQKIRKGGYRISTWWTRCRQVLRGLLRVPAIATVWSFVSGVTALGWAAAITTVLAVWGWLTQQWVEAQIIAVCLGLLCVLAVLWAIGRTDYRVSLSLASSRVSVGERAVGEVRVQNAAKRGLASSVVEMPVGQGLAAFMVPRLALGQDHREAFTIPTHRRGVIAVGPVTSVRGDALGLVRREQRWHDPVDLYVHPRTVSLDSNAVGFIRDVEGVTTQELSSSDVSFHALRDYIAGDDRRNVHWKTTARTGRLMVRQFEETRRSHLLILLDLRTEVWGSEEEFETGVSVAASLAMAAMRDRRELSVVTQRGQFASPSPTRVLDQFSELETVTDVSRPSDLARNALEQVPGASVVVIITGTGTPVSELHRTRSRIPVNVVSVGLRCAEGQAPGRQQVGGLSVLTVGELEQLPRVLRRALG